MNWNSILKNNTRFTSFSVVILLVIIGFEFLGIQYLQETIAPSISQPDAVLMLQSLITFDAALLSFSAVVYSTFLGREMTLRFLLNLIFWMVSVVILFLLSIIDTFYAFSQVSPDLGLQSKLIVQPLGVTLIATTVFFFSIGVHAVRIRLKDIIL